MTSPYYQDDFVTIYHGDAADVLPTITAADLIVTDPPYTFGIASTGQSGAKAGGWGDLMNSATWYASWLHECRRLVSHRNGAAWVFNSWRSFPVLARSSYMADWPIRSLLVWDKDWISASGHQGLRQSYELVALFAEGEFTIADRSVRDIWKEPWSTAKPHHPAEKPVSLLRRLMLVSGMAGVRLTSGRLAKIVDPFMGSGSTLVAAKGLGLHAVGIEIEERYCEVAADRCRQEVLELSA